MNKFIVIPINLFTLEQQILLCDENSTAEFAKVELAKVPEVLADLAYAQHIDKIKLVGNFSYAAAMRGEILSYAKHNYAEKEQLNVEILEG